MRVLFDYQIFGQRYGGVSRYFAELVAAYGKMEEIDPIVLCPVYQNEYLKQLVDATVIGVRVPYVSKMGRFVHFINKFCSMPVVRSIKHDIFHETYYCGTRIAPHSSKVVVTVYDMIHEKFSALYPAPDKTSINKAAAVTRADHIISISESTKRDLVDILGVDPAKVSVTYLGHFIPSQFDGINIRLIDQPYILYVGSRGGYKNADRLLEAFSTDSHLRRDFRILFFGGGPLTNAERDRISIRWKLSDHHVIHTEGTDHLLARAYRHAACFVYPSLYEGFGIPLLEAMGAGCPVACSKGGSLPEVAGNAAEVFDGREPQAIANAIRRIVYNTSRADELRRLGFLRANEFSWKRCADETFAIYRAII